MPNSNDALPSFRVLATIIAELGITVLGVFALLEGIDGAIFVTIIAALAGLGGYNIKKTVGGTNGKAT